MDDTEDFTQLAGAEWVDPARACNVYLNNGKLCGKPAVWRATLPMPVWKHSRISWLACQRHYDLESVRGVKWKRIDEQNDH